MAKVKAYEWNDYKWDGWWQGDTGKPIEYEDVAAAARLPASGSKSGTPDFGTRKRPSEN